MNTIPLSIIYQGMLLKGYAASVESFHDFTPSTLLVYIQGWYIGTLSFKDGKWSMDKPIDPAFVEQLGKYIHLTIQKVRSAMRV